VPPGVFFYTVSAARITLPHWRGPEQHPAPWRYGMRVGAAAHAPGIRAEHLAEQLDKALALMARVFPGDGKCVATEKEISEAESLLESMEEEGYVYLR